MRPLPADSSRVLVSHAADGELPESVAELLAERSGGNPFFLEEAIRDLIERGALERRNGGWQLAVGVDELAIPPRCRDAAGAARPPRPADARRALARGRDRATFGLPLLERLVPKDELTEALTELQRLDLIVEKRRRPNPEYRFRHGLVRRSPTRASSTRRRKLHKRVGEALEEIYRESPEEAYGLRARHFSEAEEPEKAVDYLLKAGDAARAVYADREALEHYREARRFLAPRRRAASPRHALQDGARLPPRLRLREGGGDVRRGVQLPRRRGPRLPTTERLETASAARGARPARSTRPRPATSPSSSSAASSWSTRS